MKANNYHYSNIFQLAAQSSKKSKIISIRIITQTLKELNNEYLIAGIKSGIIMLLKPDLHETVLRTYYISDSIQIRQKESTRCLR
ncbi:unnamed protein product [Paramecium primaurelia]|uniref:Uncharacterized protein n=1 Tax=Paramecium primaurelia TaxID=5886 RepID=A0A8S1MS62_PARPR|nr:unnamed protein product [Paramecium primaurelia]